MELVLPDYLYYADHGFLDMILKRIFCWANLLPSVVPKWGTIKKDFSSFQIEGLHLPLFKLQFSMNV
jgi:hypothetical protein